jgi:hypothetical protein
MVDIFPHPNSIKFYARVASNITDCGQSIKVVGIVEVRPQGIICLIVLVTTEEKRVICKDGFERRAEEGRLSLVGGGGERGRFIEGIRV